MRYDKMIVAGLTAMFVLASASIYSMRDQQDPSVESQNTYNAETSEFAKHESVIHTVPLVMIEPLDNVELPEIYPSAECKYEFTEHEIEMLAQTVWGEARGCSLDEQKLVVWTVLQRVDSEEFGDTIEAVLTEPKQFVGYSEEHPVLSEIYAMCFEETRKWAFGEEAQILEPYVTTLPYLYFDGRDGHNWFREEWKR